MDRDAEMSTVGVGTGVFVGGGVMVCVTVADSVWLTWSVPLGVGVGGGVIVEVVEGVRDSVGESTCVGVGVGGGVMLLERVAVNDASLESVFVRDAVMVCDGERLFDDDSSPVPEYERVSSSVTVSEIDRAGLRLSALRLMVSVLLHVCICAEADLETVIVVVMV